MDNNNREYVITYLTVRHVRVLATNDVQAEIEAWKKLTQPERNEVVALHTQLEEGANIDLPYGPLFHRVEIGQQCFDSPDREWLNGHLPLEER